MQTVSGEIVGKCKYEKQQTHPLSQKKQQHLCEHISFAAVARIVRKPINVKAEGKDEICQGNV